MKPLFKASEYADFDQLESTRLAGSSYKNIAFPLGCSRSEFQMNLDDREVSLLNKKGKVSGFVRIKSVMFTHIYLDLFCLGDVQSCEDSLNQLQKHLVKNYHNNKFFVQILEHENLEQKILENNGYVREASLSEHVWLNGGYCDVYIYGSPLYNKDGMNHYV